MLCWNGENDNVEFFQIFKKGEIGTNCPKTFREDVVSKILNENKESISGSKDTVQNKSTCLVVSVVGVEAVDGLSASRPDTNDVTDIREMVREAGAKRS